MDISRFDPSRWTPVSLAGAVETRRDRAEIETNLGLLSISLAQRSVFRLRIGPAGADYGILASDEADRPTIAGTAGPIRLRSGTLELALDRDPARFAFRRDGTLLLESITDRHFTGRFRLPAIARGEEGWLVSLALPSEERVYGLGEKFGRLDRRGQLLSSRNEDALGVSTERSYKNVPFAWSPGGWGVFVHTPATVVHAVGHAALSQRSYALLVEDECLDLFLFSGSSPAKILDAYTKLTGRPARPPRWSLGAWASRAYYKTEADALATAEELRRRRFPTDVITLDGRAWQDTNTRFLFEWDPSRYPDPAAALAKLKSLGYRICVWEYPYVSIHNPRHAELAEKGYFLKNLAGDSYRYDWDPSPFGSVLTPLPPSGLIDFTNPEAYAFWRDQHAPLFKIGVDVVKSDFGEQIPDWVVAANGDSGKRLHNAYALLYNRCVFEATERYGDDEPMVWARSGWSSSQRYPVQWGGDPQADWEGLAASIRGGLGWGMSGIPCYASDLGGFYGEPTPELYLRWVQAGVFFSHFRFHGVGAREPWAFGSDAEAIARRWFELRYRLIPYLDAALAETSRTGMPVMRAMALAFPEEPESWGFEQQFLCGPALLVVPILEPGGRVVAYLPEGRWHDLWSGDSLEGGRSLVIEAPLDRIPVFGRHGHVVPLGPVAQTTAEQGPAIAELWAFGFEGKVELPHNTDPPAVRSWECKVQSASAREVVFKG